MCTRTRAPRPWAAAVLITAAVILLAAGCGTSRHGQAAAAATSGRSAVRAEKTSAGGRAVKKTAAQVADACKPAGGWDDMYPGVTGASQARTAFIRCEKIPRGQLAAWGICIGTAYAKAPAGGDPGTPAEDKRQTYLAARVGTCTQTARKGKT